MKTTPTVPMPGVRPPASDDSSTITAATAAMTATMSFARRTTRSPAAAADSVWVPAVSAALILAAGAMSLATGQPWLFAALGPTAMLIAASPGHSTTRFHAIVLGHLTAFVCAWLAVLLFGASGETAMLAAKGVTVSRVWASAAAVGVTALVQPSLRAYHPPAAATALLVTLGAYRLSWKTALAMLAGVLVVALLGEWFQRLRLREQTALRTRRPGTA